MRPVWRVNVRPPPHAAVPNVGILAAGQPALTTLLRTFLSQRAMSGLAGESRHCHCKRDGTQKRTWQARS